ncbi:MAG: acyl--CoA ligase [Sphingomonadales bacterium]|nr:acyl--CoA ligase [Sphingomonadales bacterium]
MPDFGPESPFLPEILALHARWQPAKAALVVGDETVSWAELDAETNRVANGLKARGIGPGDFVAIVMKNGRAMPEVLLGIMKAGACSVPLNLSITDAAVAAMIKDCGAKLIFATADQTPRVDAIGDALTPEQAENRICAGDAAGWEDYESWKSAQPDQPPGIEVPGDAPCNVIYSSGTTGMPKGIVHTHQGRLDWAYDCGLAFRYHADTRTICTIGLYSNIMWLNMLCTALAGGTLIIHDRFDANEAIADITKQRVTHTAMVPIQFQRMVEAGATADQLASFECAITVGSKMHADLKKTMLALMPDALYELYGLTEGIITIQEPQEAVRNPESVGRPILGCDIKIVGDDNREVPQGASGEIVSRARYIMPGYLNRAQATEEAQWRDDQGRIWLRTGDMGRLDEEMNLYIVDRKKDMILSGGQNIYPADIEAILLTHPEVNDAAVIGVPSKKWGETPLAVVVRESGAALEAEALLGWTNGQLGKQQRIADVCFVDELPRNPNGKVLKRELRQQFSEEP